MNLDDLLGPKPNVIDLRAESRWEAIDELVNHLATGNKIKAQDKEAITASVKKREEAMTTGIGYHIAIPHASTDLVNDVVAIVGRSRKGIRFDTLDGQMVNLVLLFLVPSGQFQKHVNLLANFAKLVHTSEFRDGLWGRFS